MRPLRSLRPVVRAVQLADEKLTRVAMHLMKLRTGAPAPVHPKNVMHGKGEGNWFASFLPGPGQAVLDLGAGTATLTLEAARRGARLTAIEGWDNNLRLLEAGRVRLEHPELVTAIKHDLEAFPYPVASGAFDVVVSHDVIEHLNNRLAHLREAARALKPGGKLIISGPNRATLWKRLRGAVGLSMLADADHKIEYTREEFLAELASAGFTRIVFETTGSLDAPVGGLFDLTGPVSLALYERTARLKTWLGRRLPSEASGFLFVLEKN